MPLTNQKQLFTMTIPHTVSGKIDKGAKSTQHVAAACDIRQPDKAFEKPLRPQKLAEFTGQCAIKERLQILIQAAMGRKEPLPHTLFCGPPGLGKTSLASILTAEMQARLIVTSGPVLEKAADLAGLLLGLNRGDVLFIDEIHRLDRTIEEYLYTAMEDFSLDIITDSGNLARAVKIHIKPFTLVGATTRQGLLTSPLRSRFPFSFRLDYYEPHLLRQIAERSAAILGLAMPFEVSQLVADRARGTPRITNNLVRWLRDFAQTRASGKLTLPVAQQALQMLDIDDLGLEQMERRYLKTIIEHYDGGPAGINAIAYSLGEEPHSLEEVYEPYLVQLGMIQRQARGRVATHKARQHMGYSPKSAIGDSLL